MDMVASIVAERPVVIFSRSNCCLSESVKSLFYEFGVNPAIYELNHQGLRSREIEQALGRLGCNPVVPAVFIGAELVGGVNEVMSLHLKSNLKPRLRQAGALWV